MQASLKAELQTPYEQYTSLVCHESCIISFIVNPSKDCSVDLDSDVCGEDHKTYKSECALSTRGISLAYYGPCKGECFVDDTRVSCSFIFKMLLSHLTNAVTVTRHAKRAHKSRKLFNEFRQTYVFRDFRRDNLCNQQQRNMPSS